MPAIVDSRYNITDILTPWMQLSDNTSLWESPHTLFETSKSRANFIEQIFEEILIKSCSEIYLGNQYTLQKGQLIQTSLDSTFYIENILKWIWQNDILIHEPSHVREYILQHPDILSLLLYVCKIALDKFQTSAQLSLAVYRDPEIKDQYLTLYVRQKQYDSDILEKIEDICEKYESELARTSGWLHITTDFQPPKNKNGI